ncbi:hypothetical protein BDZ97DRAFT_1873597 [Flammula alnicola]|nr:hypothetical protein BDZ97DRAFT_1873597 [Flammula alnicola]
MDNPDNPANDPKTPTHARTQTALPPFSPRTPLRKRMTPIQDPGDEEHTPIKDVTLASGASVIIRGVGANKKNSDPVQLMNDAINKIRAANPTLAQIIVKPFNASRSEWTTICYIIVDPSILAGTTETEPRTDLLELWMNELAAYDPKWSIAWTPAKYGQDKRMWVRFPDLNDTRDQEAAKEKALQWAKTNNYAVCSSYCHKGGVTLTLAHPHEVDAINQRGQVTVKGLNGPTRVACGRQIEIQNPFELIVIGAMSEYEGLDGLIEQWVEEEFQLEGQSMLAGARIPPNEREALVFHMTTWAATAKVLSPSYQTAFTDTFAKYKILPPQMLHKVNTDAIYRISGNLRDEVHKGADSVNQTLQNIARRMDNVEQRNEQQHHTTQLQLAAVTSSLNTMTQTIAGLEDRVVNTQRAILAQSREIGLTRNVTDTSVNILTLQMNIILENNPDKKKEMENLLEVMKAQKTNLQATIQNASNEFMAIVSHPIAQLTQAPTLSDANAATPMPTSSTPTPLTPSAPPGFSQQAPQTPPNRRRSSGTPNTSITDHESSATKRRRVDTTLHKERIADPQEDIVPSSP